MANRNFLSKYTYSMAGMPVRLTSRAAIGGSGAPTIQVTNQGIKSITRLAAGVYQLQLDDNYNSFTNFKVQFRAPVTGSAINGGSFVATTVYEIITLGTTTQAQWVTAGVPAGITAAVGTVFLAAGVGAGTGTVKELAASGINAVEIVGNPQQMLSNQPFVQGSGGAYINFKCIGPTDADTTTPIAKDPASGSTMYIEVLLNNSSVQ